MRINHIRAAKLVELLNEKFPILIIDSKTSFDMIHVLYFGNIFAFVLLLR